MMISKEIYISGRVHGVGFRYFIWEKATALYLKGYVKNTSDGKVQIEVEGDENNVNELIFYCKQGSKLSIVERVDIQSIPLSEYDIFEIKR